jgi:hypothetical protein
LFSRGVFVFGAGRLGRRAGGGGGGAPPPPRGGGAARAGGRRHSARRRPRGRQPAPFRSANRGKKLRPASPISSLISSMSGARIFCSRLADVDDERSAAVVVSVSSSLCRAGMLESACAPSRRGRVSADNSACGLTEQELTVSSCDPAPPMASSRIAAEHSCKCARCTCQAEPGAPRACDDKQGQRPFGQVRAAS